MTLANKKGLLGLLSTFYSGFSPITFYAFFTLFCNFQDMKSNKQIFVKQESTEFLKPTLDTFQVLSLIIKLLQV
jgi:hypothetical protein